MNQRVRNSNLEMLRILAMYMIVFIHANMYLGHFCGGKTWLLTNGIVNGICNIGVTCFILISGYFGLRFSLKKLLKMEVMMIGFSIIETVLMCVFMPAQMQGAALLEQLVKTICPFITRKYWFYSCYVCLFCFSGYINQFIEQLEKRAFQRLLASLILIFSILPTFFYFEIIPDNGKGLVQMVIIYLIGRYIHKYGIKRITLGKEIGLFLVLWLINGISHEFPLEVGVIWHHFCKDNSITNLIMAVILFSWFKEWKIQSGIINRMTKNIFAVFALNNTLVNVVMHCIFNHESLSFFTRAGVVGLAVTVLLIMVGCILVGVIRELVFGKLEDKVLPWAEKYLLPIYNKYENRNLDG